MEGRGVYSGFYRNTSEEMFLKALMESPVGMPVPSMETLGFKNLSHNLRTDSEELFKSWLTNAENHGTNPPGLVHRSRQSSKRMSLETTNPSPQEHVETLQKKRSNDLLSPSFNMAEEVPDDLSQSAVRHAIDKGWQASNLYLAKAWFHSTQPMTRSRSSELRRRYAASQSAHNAIAMEAANNASLLGIKPKQELHDPTIFNELAPAEMSELPGAFVSPSNSSSSNMNAPQVNGLDRVSSVVNMLKGTLERKKLANQTEREAFNNCSQAPFPAQELLASSSTIKGRTDQIQELSAMFQGRPHVQTKDYSVLQCVDGSVPFELEQLMNPTNPASLVGSREASQSESSAAAPVVSSGFDACDGPSISSQALGICESSRKIFSDNGSMAKDLKERTTDNSKDEKPRGITRYGSVTSASPGDKGDPTKKRRVERSRKMAEAKERSSTSAVPSDMQSILKRCENLEKEVRSLKLNLSFMNRKDSEQTKQIEELQKQNEELTDEKERLLEEIERIISETGTG
ncbi:hypothetical protein MLD38_027833 [Melastoma candidum]|uniref:Uncharacterized protein n=1 Tax=Melastoma candidum TaxID=119954 RepID=A0ACB9P4G0_9MYRT|nr:hypothetical protein MLD38_027833 [Melastoma candidum]